VGWKQALGYGGTMSTAAILELPISRWSVTRSEQLLTAGIVSAHRSWHARKYGDVAECATVLLETKADVSEMIGWELYVLRGDATNASTIRSHKDLDQFPELSEARMGWPDLAIVPEHATGVEAVELLARAAAGLGMESWQVKFGQYQNPTKGSVAEMITELRKRGMTYPLVYIFGTDQGGDQQKACRLIEKAVASDCNILVFWNWCLAHQCHLVVKRQLARLDAEYFSTLAKLTNCWRSAGNPARLRRAWTQWVSAARAVEVTARLPQRPLTGRWGSVFENERHWLSCGQADLKLTYTEALVKHHRRVEAAMAKASGSGKGKGGGRRGGCKGGGRSAEGKGGRGAPAPVNPEDPDNEETYREKLGRWLKDVMEAIDDPIFWLKLHIAHYAKQPIMRLCHWLQTQAKLRRERLVARLPPPDRSPMQVLVTEKAGEIAELYDKLLDSVAMRDAVNGYSTSDTRARWRSEAVLLIIEGGADFQMRVGSK
ncbi:unnamed protein product, partial [Prorocentrum cordatum]